MPIYQLLRSKAITGFGKLGKVRALSMYVAHSVLPWSSSSCGCIRGMDEVCSFHAYVFTLRSHAFGLFPSSTSSQRRLGKGTPVYHCRWPAP